MVLRARGEPFDENELHANASPKGQSIGLAVSVLGGYDPDLDEDELLVGLRLLLEQGRTLIITVGGPAYVKYLGTRPAGHPSRHGQLASPGDRAIPVHTVVVVAFDDIGFHVLDPYYPADGQPIRMSDEVMLAIWAGAVVAV
jgi:hypothetical protein